MSANVRPAGLEAWAKCEIDGCFVKVWGPVAYPQRCRAHGGVPAFQESTDPFGIPVTERPVPPPAASAS